MSEVCHSSQHVLWVGAGEEGQAECLQQLWFGLWLQAGLPGPSQPCPAHLRSRCFEARGNEAASPPSDTNSCFFFLARWKGSALAFLSQRAADSSFCTNFSCSNQGRGTEYSSHCGGVLKSLPIPLELGRLKAFSLQYRLSCQQCSILWIMAALLNDGNAWWLSFTVVFYLLSWPSCLAWALY